MNCPPPSRTSMNRMSNTVGKEMVDLNVKDMADKLKNILVGLSLLVAIFPHIDGDCYTDSVKDFLSNIGAPSNIYDIGHPFGVNDHHSVREALDMQYDSGSHCYVARVNYDKDSHSGTNDRRKGVQFFTKMQGYDHGATDVTLEYQVYFPSSSSFPWTPHGTHTDIGGKLPGLYGGPTHCSGGNPGTDCFSTRYMWRDGGKAELYMYFPKKSFTSWKNSQDSGVSIEEHINSDGTKYGTSVRTSKFKFSRGCNTLKQRVHLNDIGHTNGFMQVYLGGNKMFTLHNVAFRTSSSVKIMGLFFSTFFGGHDSNWSSQHDTYTLYRNIKVTVRA